MSDQDIIREWLRKHLAKGEAGTKKKKDLAQYLGVSPSAISRMLQVQPDKEIRAIDGFELAKMVRFFGVPPPEGIGAEISADVSMSEKASDSLSEDHVQIPEHDVRASAGPGTIVESEAEIASWPLPRQYVRHNLGLRSAKLAVIEVIGDSMEPTLHSGDKIMIDLADKSISQPGVFALYDGDATVVKRVEKVPGAETVKLISDNPRHGTYEVDGATVHIAGRVVWFGRKM